jgi:hypothetical protein
MEGSQPRYSDMAPGLEQVIEAGDTLVLRDNDQHEFAVTARECTETMDFLKAFDEWFTAKQRGGFSMGILDALWNNVSITFNALPMRIQRDLPSFKAGGVLLKGGHDHARP